MAPTRRSPIGADLAARDIAVEAKRLQNVDDLDGYEEYESALLRRTR